MSDAETKHDTARVAMWIFLATEVMLFGGLFTVYAVYRGLYSNAFALAGRHMEFALGTINTAVLIVSSLTMALAVQAAKKQRPKAVVALLVLTMALGCCFLGIKAVEYTGHIHHHLLPGRDFKFGPVPGVAPPGVELFFCLYFVMTGLHAFHMVAGVSLLSFMVLQCRRARMSPTAVEMSGLYWHFIDVVWIFLYPLFYLIGGR